MKYWLSLDDEAAAVLILTTSQDLVAVQKPAASSAMVDAAEGTDWSIGCSLTLKTRSNEVGCWRCSDETALKGTRQSCLSVLQEYSGTVFGYDPNTQTLMLKEAGTHGGVCNLRLLKVSAIKVSSVAAADVIVSNELKSTCGWL